MAAPLRIGVQSPEMIGHELSGHNTQSGANAAWPATDRAYLIPLKVRRKLTTTAVWWYNGNTLTNNIDVGIVDELGNVLASIGSTARSGTSAIQSSSLAYTLYPGLYYLAASLAGTSGTVYRYAPGSIVIVKGIGCMMADSAFPLPSSLTLAAITDIYIPLIGMDYTDA